MQIITDFRYSLNIAIAIFLMAGCAVFLGEKKQLPIDITCSEDKVVFILPQLPSLGTLYVDSYNPQSIEHNKWEIVWMIDLHSHPIQKDEDIRIFYGEPLDTIDKYTLSSIAHPLKADLLYSVSMDIGCVVASTYFVLEEEGGKLKPKKVRYHNIDRWEKE